jgi:GTP-binding protein
MKAPAPLGHLPIEFLGSFPDPTQPLTPPLPEIALLGRSNVGKSSLLNALVGRRNLARVSGTPGKTTTLNVYRLPTFYLVDLPGYGFAHASKAEREAFRRLIEGCVERREHLAGIVWLLDCRHRPSADDLTFRELLSRSERPILIALTKADKLSRNAQKEQEKVITGELGFEADQVLLTSSRTGEGIADLGESLLATLAERERLGQ